MTGCSRRHEAVITYGRGAKRDVLRACCCAAMAAISQARIEEVVRALTAAGLPFGAKAAEPKAIGAYPFHHDQKNAKVFWDVRKVCCGWAWQPHGLSSLG